jgi:FlaA1/EpsC-like NDP-sugar epimerase
MNKIIIIGAGGHATSCIDVIESENKYKIFGLIDNKNNFVKSKRKYKIIGVDTDLHKIRKEIKNVHIGIAHLGNVKNRNQIIKNLISLNLIFLQLYQKMHISLKHQ